MKWRAVATRLTLNLPVLIAAAGFLVGAQAGPPAKVPLGLPSLPGSARTSPAVADLGRKLFFDRRLSFNGTMSCAMCHVPEEGFTSNGSRTAVGMQGKSLRRNAPALYNVVWQPRLFHDGREDSLANQVWLPLIHADEMANPSVSHVLARIRGLRDYNGVFEKVFSGHGSSMGTVSAAIAAYEATLVSGNSRFDRRWYGGDASAMSAHELSGFNLFRGKAGCVACHTVGKRDALFSDGRFHVTGAGFAGGAERFTVPLAAGISTELSDAELASFAGHDEPDLGRFEITQKPEDRYAFKTPSLRNVSRSAPYMHDGSIATLEEVIEFYSRGGGTVIGKSPLLKPLALSADEKRALVAFLKSLDGDNIDALAKAARRNLPVELGGNAPGY
ncbi:MAG: cytochrome c peroxidase [Betaproteobacteria bacterium]|jgi:cytochrome c peroxidase